MATKFNLTPFGGFIVEEYYGKEWTYSLYTGAMADYKDLIGLGFTIGSETSIMVSTKLFNSLRLNLVLSENFDLPYTDDYGWSIKGKVSYSF